MIDDRSLISYAVKVAQKLGLSIPDPNYILSQMNLKIPQPIIVDNGTYQMWIDKYYIAYSKCDSPQVKYIYITKEHIKEECESMQLPGVIKKAFTAAQRAMAKTGLDYYLDKTMI